MQRQRQELSQAVRQLTENSNTLYNQMKSPDSASNMKKRPNGTSWMETDLDSNHCIDHAMTMMESVAAASKPLYVDTINQYPMDAAESSGMESGDDLLDPAFAGLTNQEKQEIKTVRIVKRESERRQRDRERTNSTSLNLDHVQEEESFVDDFKDLQNTSVYRDTYEAFNQVQSKRQELTNSNNPFLSDMSASYPIGKAMATTTSMDYSNYYPVSMMERNYMNYDFGTQSNNSAGPPPSGSATGMLSVGGGGLKGKTESIQSLTKSIGDLSPVFQSEAARQIIYEMSGNTSEDNSDSKMPLASKHRRTIPKEKRRHNTAPNNVLPKTVHQQQQQQQSENDMNKPV